MSQIDDVSPKNLIQRQIWESDEMFELRRTFIERHVDSEKFRKNRNRLFCLAQLLINIEFLECSYDQKIMKEVAELAQGLIETRHEKRQMIVEKVFSSQKDVASQPASDEPSTSKKVENDDIRGQKRSFSDAADTLAPGTIESRPSKKPAPASNEKTKEIADSAAGFWQKPPSAAKALLQTKTNSMHLVRAQFCIAPNNAEPLNLLNRACNQCKFQWRIDFSQPNFCELSIEGVLVVRQRHWGDEERARLEACKKCAEILRRNSLEIQEPTKNVFHLFTSKDLRLGRLEAPDSSKFEPIEMVLRAIQSHIKKNDSSGPGKWRKDPRGFLESACSSNSVPFSLERKHASGWKEDIVVTVAGVELYSERSKVASRNKEQEIEKDACEKSIDNLLKSVVDNVPLNFVENVEDGKLVLNPPLSGPVPASPNASGQEDHVIESPVLSALPATTTIDSKTFSIETIDFEAISMRFMEKLGVLKATVASKPYANKNIVQRINEACNKIKIKVQTIYTGSNLGPFECHLMLDDILVATGSASGKKLARANVYEIFGQKLNKKRIFLSPRPYPNSDSLILIASDDDPPENCDVQNGNNKMHV